MKRCRLPEPRRETGAPPLSRNNRAGSTPDPWRRGHQPRCLGVGCALARNVARDYWVAFSEHAGLLWIFQTRLAREPAWYLHGVFA